MKTIHLIGAAVLALALAVPFFAAYAAITEIPTGDYASALGPFVSSTALTVMSALVGWVLTRVGGAYITSANRTAVDQLLERAVQYGVNMAVQAVPTSISVTVPNEVVAHALKYVFEHGPAKLINWMGGAKLIEQKIIARIKLVLPE